MSTINPEQESAVAYPGADPANFGLTASQVCPQCGMCRAPEEPTTADEPCCGLDFDAALEKCGCGSCSCTEDCMAEC